MKSPEARCPICSSLAQFWREKSGYQVYRCTDRHCRHGFVHPMPSTVQLEDFYSTSADTLENSGSWTMAEDYKKCPDVVKAFYNRARLRRLRKAGLLRSKETRVLDIGCSTGIFLRILKDEGFQHLSGRSCQGSKPSIVLRNITSRLQSLSWSTLRPRLIL